MTVSILFPQHFQSVDGIRRLGFGHDADLREDDVLGQAFWRAVPEFALAGLRGGGIVARGPREA